MATNRQKPDRAGNGSCVSFTGNANIWIVNRLYAFVGWAIVALGGLHMLATIRLSASTPAFRVWFFGSGLAMALGGALNLLHRSSGHSARGLRIVCRVANILLTLLGAVAGAVTGASIVEYILIMSLLGGALILSWSRSSLKAPHESERT
jgi:putative Ca2+/H+ antiporter (TMEM165/GDT1 family)